MEVPVEQLDTWVQDALVDARHTLDVCAMRMEAAQAVTRAVRFVQGHPMLEGAVAQLREAHAKLKAVM